MAVPSSADARRFRQCAQLRYDEAAHLYAGGFGSGAVYLAGYAVECVLKALLLSATPVGKRAEVFESFRGNLAHDFAWLRQRYGAAGGAPVPRGVAAQFAVVSVWTTDLRYAAKTVPLREAKKFLAAAEAIIHWAEGRL